MFTYEKRGYLEFVLYYFNRILRKMNVSAYYTELSEIHQERYNEKISLLGIDPYVVNLEDCSTDISDFPKLLYPDIVMYLVYTKSAYTMDEMKAYKSLEAYNQAVCGWVRKICVKQFDSNILILGKVMHSQRLNEKLPSPWIICKDEGNIISAHCDCVAGLGEVCTHIAAVLFSIDEAVRKLEEVTRTGVKAYWMPPSNKPVDPKLIREMDLSNPKRKCLEENPLRLREKEKEEIPPISAQEKSNLLSNLAESRGTVLHLMTKPFSEEIKLDIDKRKSFHIMSLYKEEYEKKSLAELQEIGAQINITLHLEDCESIERETKSQAKCRAWFVFRRGRITASKFKRCCRTSLANPSISLIKEVCYPITHKYKIKALDYGCLHEKEAIKDFSLEMKKNHQNFKIESMGLCINPKYPYFGASPDGIISCDCCGMALVEIKCPYCARFSGVTDLSYKSFMETVEGKITVKKDHEYYYQVQMQLALTEQEYCYLVAWSKKNFIFAKVAFEESFWLEKSEVAKKFFQQVILPEALGKHFTKKEKISESEIQDNEQDEWEVFSDVDVYEEVVDTAQVRSSSSEPGPSTPPLFCICQKEDDHITPMIACDSPKCPIEWYHLKCVGLDTVPSGNWICGTCNK